MRKKEHGIRPKRKKKEQGTRSQKDICEGIWFSLRLCELIKKYFKYIIKKVTQKGKNYKTFYHLIIFEFEFKD